MRQVRRLSCRSILIGGYFIAASAAVAAERDANSDEWPTLKKGIWEFSRTVEHPEQPGKAETSVSERCTEPSEEMKRQNAMLTQHGCQFTPITHSGNAYSFSVQCQIKGMGGTSSSVLTVDGDSAYTVDIVSDMGNHKSKEKLVAHRKGDCAG